MRPRNVLLGTALMLSSILVACGESTDLDVQRTSFPALSTSTVGTSITEVPMTASSTTVAAVPTTAVAPSTTTSAPAPIVLRVDAIAGIAVGSPLDDALGALTARFGAPDRDAAWRPSCALFPDDPEWRVVEWPYLTIVFTRGSDGPGVLEHFRWGPATAGSAVPDATSPSGLHLGMTAAQARAAGASIEWRPLGSSGWWSAIADGLEATFATEDGRPDDAATPLGDEARIASIGTRMPACD